MRAQDRADQERPRDLGVVFSRVDEALDGVGELGGRHAEGFFVRQEQAHMCTDHTN